MASSYNVTLFWNFLTSLTYNLSVHIWKFCNDASLLVHADFKVINLRL
jgi:hypothetical protein